ncbi:MAG: response regulator [Anaeromyxobacteraceae bacterium]
MLVADDDEDLREALAQILDAHCIRVVLAADGQHALDHLAQGVSPCAILLDWMMPRVDGEAFLTARAESAFLSSIPVFVISASHRPTGDPRIHGFLSKPFDIEDLLPMLRGVCGEHCPAARKQTCLDVTAPPAASER